MNEEDVEAYGQDTIGELTEGLIRFSSARAWEQFQSPKNLAMALAGEVGEVCSLMQWVDSADSDRWAAENRAELSNELADVAAYLLLLSHRAGVDLAQAVRNKTTVNEHRYPVARAMGNAVKYDRLGEGQ